MSESRPDDSALEEQEVQESYPTESREGGPGGRPTEYKPEFCHIGHQRYAEGATDFELALELGVHVRTLYRWRSEHPEFRQSLKLGREAADQRVEDSLYHRAVGYNHHAIHIGTWQGHAVVTPYIEHVPPDVGAASLWLTNRRAREWKHTKTVEVKDDSKTLAAVDAIIERFKKLKYGDAVEGEVVPVPAIGNGHG